MNIDQIKTRLNEVFVQVFGAEEAERITETTQARDVKGWDSLGHMNLLVAIEEKFGIEFSYADIASFNVVGDIINCLIRRLG